MPDKELPWPANITRTVEIGTQRGMPNHTSFDDEINAYLAFGWRILNTYVEDKSDENREECVCLLGWVGSEPQFPESDEEETMS